MTGKLSQSRFVVLCLVICLGEMNRINGNLFRMKLQFAIMQVIRKLDSCCFWSPKSIIINCMGNLSNCFKTLNVLYRKAFLREQMKKKIYIFCLFLKKKNFEKILKFFFLKICDNQEFIICHSSFNNEFIVHVVLIWNQYSCWSSCHRSVWW